MLWITLIYKPPKTTILILLNIKRIKSYINFQQISSSIWYSFTYMTARNGRWHWRLPPIIIGQYDLALRLTNIAKRISLGPSTTVNNDLYWIYNLMPWCTHIVGRISLGSSLYPQQWCLVNIIWDPYFSTYESISPITLTWPQGISLGPRTPTYNYNRWIWFEALALIWRFNFRMFTV